DAKIPAVNAPMKAAAAAGSDVKSTNSRRRVLATAPIKPAVAAILTGLINIIEKPNTPQKLAGILNRQINHGPSPNGKKLSGFKSLANATNQPTSVAITMIDTACTNRSIPDRISDLAKSNPLVIKGNPGIANNIAPI